MDNSKNKKHIAKIIILCLTPIIPVIALALYAYLFPMWYMDWEYPCWKQEKDILCSGNTDYDIIALGDSGCNGGLVPQILSPSTFNFALSGATPVTMYYTMETYLGNHKAPKIAFIMFRNIHYTYEGSFWTRNIYFHYLTTSQEIDFLKVTSPLDKTGYSTNYLEFMAYKFYSPTKYMTAISNAEFHKRKSDNDEYFTLVNDNRGRYYGMNEYRETFKGYNDGLASDCRFEKFQICAINEFYLHRLINLLQENNVTVIMEQLPFNETSFFNIAENVKQEEQEFYANLQSEFGIQSNSELFYYDDFCFLDGHHLNYRGAAKYSHYICKKYADLLAPYRTDRTARYNELLEYVKKITQTENGVLETLNDDIFSLRIFVKRDLPTASIQYKILSEMDNFEFANSPKGFYSPIETEHFIIEARMKEQ